MKTSTIDYCVTAHGIIERGMFYNYLHELGCKDDPRYTKEELINSAYPFGLVMKKKKIMLIEGATMCFLNQRAGRMKTIEEFKEIIIK